MGLHGQESLVCAVHTVSAQYMLGFPTFLSPPQSRAIQEGTFSHAQKEEKPGPHFFIHNSKFQKALKTELFFLSLPLTHLVTKPDLNQWEKMYS